MAELSLRLERLPAGHPSSPYNDDGTLKAPVPKLKDLELPLPGEERPAAPGTTRDHPEPRASESMSYRQRTADTDRAADDRGSLAAASLSADHKPAAGHGIAVDDEVASAPHETLDQHRAAKPGSLESPDSAEPKHGPDGSWAWKGLRLSPEQCRIADDTVSRCRTAEGRSLFGGYRDAGLTPAMRRIEGQLEHGQLVPGTEEFALKSPDRFKEKFAKVIARNPDKSPQHLAHEIHDAVRYSYIFQEEHYSEGIRQAHGRLEDHGFQLEVRRNSWRNPEYKGINSRWYDTAQDLHFEVQFHTATSWDVKQRTHDAYEQIADPRTSAADRARLRAEQAEISAAIPVPPRCTEITDYRKEGR